MSAGWVLVVSVTAAASGIAKYGLHLCGERARYRHEQALERQRQDYRLLVLRQRVAAEVKIAALLAGAAPAPHDSRPCCRHGDRDHPLKPGPTEPVEPV